MISFRPFVECDLPLLHEWFGRPHVHRWWHDEPETLEGVREAYLPAIEGRDPTDLYVIVDGERPIGMIQTYLVSSYPEYAAAVGLGEGIAAVDVLIGEEPLTGRGLGSEAIRTFVREVVFARPETVACVANPEVGNLASRRAFEKAGFRDVGEVVEEGLPCRLLRVDRGAHSS